MTSKDSLASWIREWLGRELKRTPAEIDGKATFVRLGLDSVQAMMLAGDLEDRLNRRLSPTLAWDYPTVDSIAAFLVGLPSGPAEGDLLSRIDDLSEEEIDRLLESQAKNQSL